MEDHRPLLLMAWQQKMSRLAQHVEDSIVPTHAARAGEAKGLSGRQTPHLRWNLRQTPHRRRNLQPRSLQGQTPHRRRDPQGFNKRHDVQVPQVICRYQHPSQQCVLLLEKSLGHQWMDLFQMPIPLLELPHTSRSCARGFPRRWSSTSCMSSTTI